MDKNEKKLSEYIDKLNAEKMPDEHECLPDSKNSKSEGACSAGCGLSKKAGPGSQCSIIAKIRRRKKKMDMAGRSGCCCGYTPWSRHIRKLKHITESSALLKPISMEKRLCRQCGRFGRTNNGEKKWQVSPAEEQVYIFPKMPNKSKPWEKRWLREEKPLYLRYCPEEGNPTKYGLTRRRGNLLWLAAAALKKLRKQPVLLPKYPKMFPGDIQEGYENRQAKLYIPGSTDEFKPASTAVLGKVGGNTAEIQSPVQDSPGVLEGGMYSGMADIRSIPMRQ